MLSFAPRPDAYGIDLSQAPKDRYRIVGRIAQGSMAQVYLAEMKSVRAASLPREIALKRLRPELQSDRDFVQMFFDEARIAAEMDHPNIVKTVELGELDGSFFMAMELVAGVSLRSICKRLEQRHELFPLPVLMRIAVNALHGLSFAHAATDGEGRPLRIVHRDVSPHNILVGFDGEVKLLDFGVAKAERNIHKTLPGLIKGKFAYMAPEQIKGEAIDGRADLFALGETLFEAATQHHPFFADEQRQGPMLDALVNEDPFEPTRFVRRFPPRVREILFKALARDPRDRYSSAESMRTVIEALLREAPASNEDVAALVRELFSDALSLLREARKKRDPELLVRALRVDDPELIVLDEISDNSIPILPPLIDGAPMGAHDTLDTPHTPDLPRPDEPPRRLLADPRHDTIPPRRDGELNVPIPLAPAPWSLDERVRSPDGIEAYMATWTGRFGIVRHGILKRPALDAPRAARDAIIHEARVLSILAHSGFRALYDAGEHDTRPYLVAEDLPGFSLRRVFDRCTETKTEIPTALACWIVSELASLLSAMSAARTPDGDPLNVVLEDLSPSTARVTMYGIIQVDDLSHSHSKIGAGLTAANIASIYRPPPSEHRETDKSRTIYALGAILFESVLIAHLGELNEPFVKLLSQTSASEFGGWQVPIAIADPVLAVVARAVARKPDQRYPNVHAMEVDLQRVLLRLGQPVTHSFAATWAARLLSS